MDVVLGTHTQRTEAIQYVGYFLTVVTFVPVAFTDARGYVYVLIPRASYLEEPGNVLRSAVPA